MPVTERMTILDVAVADGRNAELRDCRLDEPQPGEQIEDNSLRIVGWAVGGRSPVQFVEIVTSDEVVAAAPLDIERPGVAEAYQQVAGAERAGFQLVVQGRGQGRHQLAVRGVLADGGRVSIGTIGVEIRKHGLLARFGLSRNR